MRGSLAAGVGDWVQGELLTPADGYQRALAPARTQRGPDERGEGVTSPVECPVGCRGTAGCLCGQGELSDHPLWIEND